MGSVDGLKGVMEVTFYGPDPDYGGATASDCRKIFFPLLLDQKITPTKFKQQSNGIRLLVGAAEGMQGVLWKQQEDGQGQLLLIEICN